MSAAYLQAAVPEPFTVLGRRLKPYSLGHEILLQRFESAFTVTSEEDPTFADLIFSVFVCSMTYSQALHALRRPFWLWMRIKLWGAMLRWKDYRYFVAATELMYRYVAAGAAHPRFLPREETGNSFEAAAPLVEWVKVTLMAKLNQSEDEALNTPYALAIWNYATFWETQGKAAILTDECIEQAVELHHEIMAKLKAKEANGTL